MFTSDFNLVGILTSAALLWSLVLSAKSYLLGMSAKQLFTTGRSLDTTMRWWYGWIFYTGLYKFWPDSLASMTKILILDQISRHIYRGDAIRISHCTKEMHNAIRCALHNDYLHLSMREKAMLSLATRHLLRIYSNEGHKRHAETSKWLKEQMELLDHELKVHQKCYTLYPGGTDRNIDTDLGLLNLVTKIQAENLKAYRRYQFIHQDRQIWSTEPCYDVRWLTDFMGTNISKYFRTKLKQYTTGKDKVHIYLLISGGIDSMTMARIVLGILYDESKCFKDQYEFHGVHIDWKVRNESTIEATHLSVFFDKFNKILRENNRKCFDFRVVTSPIDPQGKDWDTKSTNYRMGLLKELGKEQECMFVLGHVVEDLLENLICNASMNGIASGKQSYLDLFGMRELIHRNGVALFRPLLLHSKPKHSDTPHLLDNAKNLDIKRRAVRRAISEYSYDIGRIRQVYSEFLEITDKYMDRTPEKMTSCGKYYVFEYDESWTPLEWRFALNSFLNLLGYNNVKRNAITSLYKSVQRCVDRNGKITVVMSKPFIHENAFKVDLDRKEVLVPAILRS